MSNGDFDDYDATNDFYEDEARTGDAVDLDGDSVSLAVHTMQRRSAGAPDAQPLKNASPRARAAPHARLATSPMAGVTGNALRSRAPQRHQRHRCCKQ
jgi:hypothetical protein